MLGNGRLEAMCFDGVKRLCHIRGKLRKKVKFFTLTFTSLTILLKITGLDKPVWHHPGWSPWLPGRQGWCDSEVLSGRGQEPQVLRRVPRVHQDQRDCRLCWRRPGWRHRVRWCWQRRLRQWRRRWHRRNLASWFVPFLWLWIFKKINSSDSTLLFLSWSMIISEPWLILKLRVVLKWVLHRSLIKH